MSDNVKIRNYTIADDLISLLNKPAESIASNLGGRIPAKGKSFGLVGKPLSLPERKKNSVSALSDLYIEADKFPRSPSLQGSGDLRLDCTNQLCKMAKVRVSCPDPCPFQADTGKKESHVSDNVKIRNYTIADDLTALLNKPAESIASNLGARIPAKGKSFGLRGKPCPERKKNSVSALSDLYIGADKFPCSPSLTGSGDLCPGRRGSYSLNS